MHRFHAHVLSLVLAVLTILSLLLSSLNTAISQGVSAYYPTGYYLLDATSHVSGNLTDLQSDNNVYMVFGSYLTRTMANYFPGFTSDVDLSPDEGTHSNFTAQQSGPDVVNDVLTETRNYGGVQKAIATGSVPYQMDKDQRGCFGAVFWNPTDSVYHVTRVEFNASSAMTEVFNDRAQGIGLSNPTSGWVRDTVRRVVYWTGSLNVKPHTAQEFYVDIDGNGKDEVFSVAVRITANGTVHTSDYMTKQVNGDVPWSVLWLGQGPSPAFNISAPLSTETTFYVSLEEDGNKAAIEVGGTLTILVPSEFANIVDVGGIGWGVANITGNRIEVQNTQPIQNAYRTYAFNASTSNHPGLYMLNVSFDGTPDEHPVGNLCIHVTGVPNSELDLEIQWTNIDYSLASEDLCIYGGSMGVEDIMVDVWSGSSWINLFPDLNSGWNNVSVSPYLASSTVTVRFKGGNEVGDTTQDWWEIDVSLLHVWSDEYASEVEFTGSSGTEELNQLNWTINGAWTTDYVNVTLQLYDYTLDGYPTSGEGHLTYTSSSTPYTDETRSQTITANSTNFRDGLGNWKMRIRGSKITSMVFNFRADFIAFETTPVAVGPVASFSVSPSNPAPNTPVVFNASDSLDPNGSIVSYLWSFGDGNITSTSSSQVTHSYQTHGDFNVTLMVVDNDSHNDSVSKIVTIHLRDIVVLDGTLSQTEVTIGHVVNITIAVKNNGTITETFNVHVFYNETLIDSQLISNLSPNAEKSLSFYWDTTGITPDAGYSIKVEAEIVPGESNTLDNLYSCGLVRIRSQEIPLLDWRPVIPYLVPAGLALTGVLIGVTWKRREKSSKNLGFDFFDTILGGGIPAGSSVLIIGGTGSGKSLLCQQLAYKYLNEGKACLFVSYDDFPAKIRESMKSFGWNLAQLEQAGNFVFIDCYSSRARKVSQERYSVQQPFALTELSIVSSTALDEKKDTPKALFLESATALFTNLDPSRVVSFLQDRGAKMKGENGVFIFTVGEGVTKPDIVSRLEEASDVIIELNVYEEEGKRQRRMRIKKLRGQRHLTGWLRFDIKTDAGIVFQRSKSI